MPNANYRSGARLEYLLKVQLERQGFYVTRSAGSQGAADLIAANGETVLFVQVAANGAADKKAIAKLKRIKCPPNCKRLLYERNGTDVEWNITEVK